MEEKLRIKKKDFYVLKAYVQAQLLLETLDDVEEENKMDIKRATKMYKNSIEKNVERFIKNTYLSNPKRFSEIMLEMKSYSDYLEKHFEII